MSVARSFRRGIAGALLILAVAIASMVSPWLVAPAFAATDLVDFGTPTAESSFATGVTFNQPVTIEREIGRVELLLTAGSSVAQTMILVPESPGSGSTTLSYRLDPSVDGHIVPNTPMTARWRLVAADDPADVALGPEVRITFVDDRFSWRTEAGELVRVHWHEGTAAFGTRALQIGEDAVREASELLQVTETEPVDFFVYADRDDFYDALGPGTRENVGGQANSEIRTMFALIPADEINESWVGIVIPHELTHLVFDTAASNPYHFPPRWLNEGLAVYLSEGYGASDRAAVEGAAASGTLIPLDGLAGQFPTSFERFGLAYAESVSAVDYLIRVHGQASLVSLIRSYAEGRTDDEAFTAALGVDMSAFSAAWLDDLGAAAPTRHGPQPAPPGPIPAAWLVEPGTSSPGASGAAAATSGPSAVPAAGSPASDGTGLLLVVIAVGVVAAILVGVALAARRRRTDAGSAG